MKSPPWPSTLTADSTTPATAEPPWPPTHLASVSTSSDSSASSGSDVSLLSNLSLQTLPSVPSLQKLSPGNLHSSAAHLCLNTLQSPPDLPVTCLAGNGNLLYAASGHEISLYDRSNLTRINDFNDGESSSGSVKAAAFCGGRVFTAHQDCKIRVWKTTPGKDSEHKFFTDLPTLNDRLRRFWLPKNYVKVRRHKKVLWIQHADAVTGIAVNDGLIYSVSWDKSLKIWRASDLRCLESVQAHEDAINAVAVSAGGTVYTGAADGKIRAWVKEKRHAMVATLEKHKSAVNALALSADGAFLYSGACDRSILVWEREDSANHMVVAGALRGHRRAILCLVSFSDLLLSGSADRTVRIWRRGGDGDFCCLAVLVGHRNPVKSLAAEWGDELNGVVLVYSGSVDGEIKVWQVSVSKFS